MKNISLLLVGLMAVGLFGQTNRGLYNINLFPEIENSAYNSFQKQGNVLLYGNIPNNSLRSDYYTLGINAVLYNKNAVTIATNMNYFGEFLFRKNSISVSYNYHLDFTRKLQGTFGLSMGILHSSLNREKAILIDPFDPIVQVLTEHPLTWFDPKISGLFCYNENFNLGFSYNSFPTKYVTVNNQELLDIPKKFNLNAKYNFSSKNNSLLKDLSLGLWYQQLDKVKRVNFSITKKISNQFGVSTGYVNNPNLFYFGLNIELGTDNKLYFNSGLNTGNNNFGNGTEIELQPNLFKIDKSKRVSIDSLAGSDEVVETGNEMEPTKIEYVYLIDTSAQEKVPIYNPDPNDFLVEIATFDDFKKVRLGHDTAKIYFKTVKDKIFKPGYYLMTKMSNSESVIDTEIKKLFTFGVFSYKLYDPKLSVYYQYVDWTMDEVESSKQIQYFDKDFKFLWTKLFK